MGRLGILLHGRETDVPLYEAALGGRVRNFVWGKGAPAYSTVSGLAKDYPTLRGFLEGEVPEWKPWTKLILVGYSSGGWAARAWMKNEGDRKLLSALLLLDCLYPDVSGGPCAPSIVEGPIEYGKLAAAQPRRRTLIATSSSYTQGCVDILRRGVPESPAVHIWAPGVSHRQHMAVVGPQAVADWVAPKLGLLPPGTGLPLLAGAAVGVAAGASAIWLTGD